MGKSQAETTEAEQLAPPSAPAQPVTFRDKLYIWRKLILPDWRELEVVQHRITVAGDDAAAIAFLRKRSDFEQVE